MIRGGVYRFDRPATTGLGDRLAQYVQLATIAELWDITIVTRWDTTTHRSAEYPRDVADFVTLPDRLLFVVDPARYDALGSVVNTGAWFRPGFDFVPETSFWMLSKARLLPANTTWNVYKRAHRSTLAQVLPTEDFVGIALSGTNDTSDYVGVHLRRGDRGGPVHEIPDDLRRYLDSTPRSRWHRIVSDSETARKRACALVACLPDLPRVPHRLRALRDFFVLARATEVVVSQPTFPGWSSFSFMAASVGEVPLVACVHPARWEELSRACECHIAIRKRCERDWNASAHGVYV